MVVEPDLADCTHLIGVNLADELVHLLFDGRFPILDSPGTDSCTQHDMGEIFHQFGTFAQVVAIDTDIDAPGHMAFFHLSEQGLDFYAFALHRLEVEVGIQ